MGLWQDYGCQKLTHEEARALKRQICFIETLIFNECGDICDR